MYEVTPNAYEHLAYDMYEVTPNAYEHLSYDMYEVTPKHLTKCTK